MQENVELGEELQAELVRRVMALEGREETLRLNSAQLETTIEALDECTGVSRNDILGIARELSRSSEVVSNPGLIKRPHVTWPISRLQLGFFTLVTLACIKLLFSTGARNAFSGSRPAQVTCSWHRAVCIIKRRCLRLLWVIFLICV